MRGVLITGAGRRVGAGIALALGRPMPPERMGADQIGANQTGTNRDSAPAPQGGWHVFVHHNHSAAQAQGVVDAIHALGGRATAVRADLGVEAEVAELVAHCDAIAPLAALVNNASIFQHDEIHSTSFQALDANMRVNLYAPALLSRALHARLSARAQEGCIVNILDNKVMALNPDHFSYTLSKVALHAMTEMLAMAFAPLVRVAAVAPGITLPSGHQTQADFERARTKSLTSGSTVEQIARAVAFILETPAFNGRTLVLDGGQSLLRHPRDVAFL